MKAPVSHVKMDTYQSPVDTMKGSNIMLPSGARGIQQRVCSGKNSKYGFWYGGKHSEWLSVPLKTMPSAPYSFSLWIMAQGDLSPAAQYPIPLSFNLPYLAIDSTTTGTFRLSYKDSGGSQRNVSGTTIVALDTWYHVTCILSPSRVSLYVDGVEEGFSTTYAPATNPNFQYYWLGVHNSSQSYRFRGRMDNIRLYDYALTADEVNEDMNLGDSDVPLKLYANGDVEFMNTGEGTYNESEDETNIEWELLADFTSSSSVDAAGHRFDSAIAGRSINSNAELDAAGFTRYLTSINSGSYTLRSGYMQAFYSSGPTGYIEYTLPDTHQWVRVKWGNFYSGTARLRLDGVTRQNLRANLGDRAWAYRYADVGATPALRLDESGIFWVSEIWVGKEQPAAQLRPDKLSSLSFHLNGRNPNLMPYSGWDKLTGTTGDFNRNGTVAENSREWGADPWGNPTILWKCIGAGGNNADGGWNHNAFPIDNTAYYRYSVWCMRETTTNGTTYHGLNGYGSTNGVLRRDNGSNNTNPYFWSGDPDYFDDWFVIVGHVFPRGSGTGSNYADSQVRDINGSTVAGGTKLDYVWRNETTTARGRSYLYYTTAAVNQWFCYPIFEKIDANSAPIEEIINGAAYHRYGLVPEKTYLLPDNIQQQIHNNKMIMKGNLLQR